MVIKNVPPVRIFSLLKTIDLEGCLAYLKNTHFDTLKK